MADEDTACVIDDYRNRIYCANRGEKLWAFGREGEGPGEFVSPTSIVRGPVGSIGIVDIRKQRLQIFEPAGQLLNEVAVPPFFTPTSHLLSTVSGWVMTEGVDDISIRQVEIDVGPGRIAWDRFFSADLVECGLDRSDSPMAAAVGLGLGHPTPGGGLVFAACKGRFVVWFDNRDDQAPSAVHPNPTYAEQFPSPEEVASYISGAKRFGLGIEPSEAEIEEYRSRPKVWYRPYQRIDERGRLWALSTRVVNDSSYLDLHTRAGYVGTVQVRHSAVGFDVLGATLVVFVDRPSAPDDPAGVPRRAIDWYDISRLAFGSQGAANVAEPPSASGVTATATDHRSTNRCEDNQDR